MGRKSNHAGHIASTFQANLVAGLLSHRRQEPSRSKGKAPARESEKTANAVGHVQASPQTKYTNAKGAANYLGISKATFCRLKAKGFFQPSPVTGRYHLDDLDREARGTLSTPERSDAAEAQPQNTFGPPETMPPLAHGESMLNP